MIFLINFFLFSWILKSQSFEICKTQKFIGKISKIMPSCKFQHNYTTVHEYNMSVTSTWQSGLKVCSHVPGEDRLTILTLHS